MNVLLKLGNNIFWNTLFVCFGPALIFSLVFGRKTFILLDKLDEIWALLPRVAGLATMPAAATPFGVRLAEGRTPR